MKTKGTETLAYKQSILRGKVTAIEFARGKLFPWDLDNITAVENGLKKDLANLVKRSQLEEADLKIKAMDRVLDLIKKSNDQ